MSQALSAISVVAALVAVYYAWRSAELGHLERRERSLAGLVEAVHDVRRTADTVVATYDGRRNRAEQNTAVLELRLAQDRLRLVLSGGRLPPRLIASEEHRPHLAALLGSRPLSVVTAAQLVLDEARGLQSDLAHPGRLARALRPAAAGRRLVEVEGVARPSGGCAVQTSRDGAQRLELVLPAPRGGLVHAWCEANDRRAEWVVSRPFATDLGDVAAVTLCLGNYGAPDSLEILARTGGHLHHLTRQTSFAADPADLRGIDTVPLPIDDARGVPAIVQGFFGNRGNFEVVTPTERGDLVHLWRDNDAQDGGWAHASRIGATAPVDAVALIHGELHDHLEVIARSGPRLTHFWRTNGQPSEWREVPMRDVAGTPITERAAGVPGFVQSRRRGSRGNFEVVTPTDDGGLMHLWRDNDDDSFVWRLGRFHREGAMDAAAVFEGRLRADDTRDLVILARGGGRVVHLRVPQPLPPPRGAALIRRPRATAPAVTSSTGELTAAPRPRSALA